MVSSLKRGLGILMSMFMVVGFSMAFAATAHASEDDFGITIIEAKGGSSISVDTTVAASGTGWSWDANTDTLTLNGFNGEYIDFGGAATLKLVGTNTITIASTNPSGYASGVAGLRLKEDLTVTGSGTLRIRTSSALAEDVCAIGTNAGSTSPKVIANDGSIDIHVESMRTAYGSHYTGGFQLYKGAQLTVFVAGQRADAVDYLETEKGHAGLVQVTAISTDANERGFATGVSNGDFYGCGTTVINASAQNDENSDYVTALRYRKIQLSSEYGLKGSLEVVGGMCYPIGTSISLGSHSKFQVRNSLDASDPLSSDWIYNTSDYNPYNTVYYLADTETGVRLPYVKVSYVDEPETPRLADSPLFDISGLMEGQYYNQKVDVSQGQIGATFDDDAQRAYPQVYFNLKEGSSLPAGLSLSAGGYISGTPSAPCEAGSFELELRDNTSARTLYGTITVNYDAVAPRPRYLTINDTQYLASEDHSGENWSWDADNETLRLSGFTGSYIDIPTDDATINLSGYNGITIGSDNPIFNVAGRDCRAGLSIYGNCTITASSAGMLEFGMEPIDGDVACVVTSEPQVVSELTLESGELDMNITNQHFAYGSSVSVKMCGDASLISSIEGVGACGVYPTLTTDKAFTGVCDISAVSTAKGYTAVGARSSEIEGSGEVAIYAYAPAGAYPTSYTTDCRLINLSEGGTASFSGIFGSSNNGSEAQKVGIHTVATSDTADYVTKVTDFSGGLMAMRAYVDATTGELLDSVSFEYSATAQGMKVQDSPIFDLGEALVGLNYEKPLPSLYHAIVGSNYDSETDMVRRANFVLQAGSVLPTGVVLQQSGSITGKPTKPCEPGTAVIEARDALNNNLIGTIEIAYGKVDVANHVASVSLDRNEVIMDLMAGDTLVATITPDYATIKDVSWSSSDNDIVAVDEMGRISAEAPGHAVITVTSSEGAKKATCDVYVKERKPEAAYSSASVLHVPNANAKYLINGVEYISDEDATIPLDPAWSETSITIVQANDEPKCNSDEYVYSLGHIHAYEITETIEATCQAPAQYKYECSCGGFYFEDFGTKLDHHVYIPIQTIEATCTTDGQTNYKCKWCDSMMSTDYVYAYGHDFAWVIDKEATYDEAGMKHEECSRCGDIRNTGTEIPALKCPTHNLVKTEALDATCTVAGHIAYWHCDTCDRYYSDNGVTEISVDELAIKPGHNLKFYKGHEATCEGYGQVDCWFCSACNKRFADEEATKELSRIATDPIGHKYNKIIPPSSVACGEPVYMTYLECDVCGKLFYENGNEASLEDLLVRIQDHEMWPRDGKAATCTEDGVLKHWKCARCDRFFIKGDDDKLVECEQKDTVIPALGHDWGAKVEQQNATCDAPGIAAHYECQRYGCDALKNVHGDEVTATDLVLAILPHSKGKLIESTATCTTPGTAAHYKCTMCNQLMNADGDIVTIEELNIPALGHKPVLVEGIEPTCEEVGYMAHYECENGCNSRWADEGMTQSLSESNTMIPAKGHKPGNLNPAVPATCTDGGHYAFSRCENDGCSQYFDANGNKVTWYEIGINSLGHDIQEVVTKAKVGQDGLVYTVCTRCGEEKSSESVIPAPAGLNIELDEAYPYIAGAIDPAAGVAGLVKDVDGKNIAASSYEVTYKNNVNVGTATMIVTMVGKYYEGQFTKTFNIVPSDQEVAVSAPSALALGKTFKVTTVGEGTKTYKSSKTSVATISSTGTITAKAIGTTTITVSFKSPNCNPATATAIVRVVPKTPTSFSVSTLSTGYKLSWTKSSAVKGYKVYRDGELVKTITSYKTHSWTDTAAKVNGNMYNYTVTAYKVVSGETYESLPSVQKKVVYLARPILALSSPGKKKLTATWNENAMADGFQVRYSTKSSMSSYKTSTIDGGTVTDKAYTTLKSGTKYYVKVRAFKVVDGVKYYGAWSAKKYVKVK